VLVDVLLQGALLFQQLRHLVVGHRLAELHRDRVVPVELRALRLQCFLDIPAYVLRLVELWLLRQKADTRALVGPRLALEFLVDARHDAEERRLASAVRPENADLRAGVEREPDVVEDDPRGWNHLAETFHDVDELRCHRC